MKLRRLVALWLCLGHLALAQDNRYQVVFKVFPPDTQWWVRTGRTPVYSQVPIEVTEQQIRSGARLEVYFKHPACRDRREDIHLTQFLPTDAKDPTIDPDGDFRLNYPVEIALEPINPVLGIWLRLREHWLLSSLAVCVLSGAIAVALKRQLDNRRLHRQQALLDEAARAATSKDDPLVEKQKQIGPYKIVDKLGEGGMASVYKALPVSTLNAAEAVAIKLMKPELSRQEDRRRFLREIQTVNELRHPNIVRLEAYGETDHDELWMAMELVRGKPLLDLIPPRGLPVSAVDGYLQPVLAGLIHAHRQGVVHRDIKPHNIMVDDTGRVKIMDFGLARSHDASKVTATGTVLGSPDYIPPEQLGGNDLDARSDQYSLGATLFELLCGRTPYYRQDTMATLMAHMTDPIPSLRELAPEVPPSVERVVQRMLEKDPNSRYGDLDAMRQAWNEAIRDPNAFSAWKPTERATPATTPKVTAPLDGGDQTLY